MAMRSSYFIAKRADKTSTFYGGIEVKGNLSFGDATTDTLAVTGAMTHSGSPAIGLAFTGTYTTSAMVLGTTGTPLTLTAHDDHIIDIYSTSASTDGSNSVRPFYMKSTMTGAAGVGGRAEFHMYTNVALGGWSNAIKGFAEYGASGKTTGLGSAVVAELTLSAGTSDGNYAPLEVELNVPSGASLGTKTAFAYFSTQGTDVATMDTSGYLFNIQGLTVASGKLFQANTAAAATHALRIQVDSTDYFVMLTDTGA